MNRPNSTAAPLRNALICLLAYGGLTVFMTWPTVYHLTDGIPGDGFDGWQNYWNLWWVKQALLVKQTSPYFTDYLYAPTGVSLLFHTLNIFNGLWTLPLQLNAGLAVAYNSVVLVSFTLAGYGGYLLSLYVLSQTPDLALTPKAKRWAAFVGGVVFTMSPFHFAHLLGHMQVFSLIWPPFYVLSLIRTLNVCRVQPLQRAYQQAILCSLFLILATLVDWYHTLYLIIFTVLATLWAMWTRPHGQIILRVGLIGLLFVGVMGPLLWPMMQQARQRPDLDTGLSQNIALSADLLAFITPSEMHPWWGEWAKAWAEQFSSTTSERLIFAGFLPLGLSLGVAWYYLRHAAIRFWLMIGSCFLLLSLGPYLHVGGQLTAWPLPYLFLYQTVPFLNLTRSLSRYDLMVMMSLGVLSSLAVARLGQRYPKYQKFLTLTIIGLICFEFLAIPYPISLIDTPPFFHTLAQEPDAFTIAALPMNWDRPTPLLYQTVHGKPLLTAYTSRDNPLELAWRTPLLQHWRYLSADIIDQPLAEIAPTIFYDFNLRYLVLDYWQMPPGPEREGTEHWLTTALPQATPMYDDGRLKVYRTPPQTNITPYLSFGQGWGRRQEEPVRRQIIQEAVLWLHYGAATTTLEVTAQGEEATIMTLWQGQQLIDEVSLNAQPTLYTFQVAATETTVLTLSVTQPITIFRLALNKP